MEILSRIWRCRTPGAKKLTKSVQQAHPKWKGFGEPLEVYLDGLVYCGCSVCRPPLCAALTFGPKSWAVPGLRHRESNSVTTAAAAGCKEIRVAQQERRQKRAAAAAAKPAKGGMLAGLWPL